MAADIQFTLPWALWGLLTIPLFWWVYVQSEQKRWTGAFQLSALATKKVIKQTNLISRLLWPISASLLLAVLWLGIAGPSWQTQVATKQASLMLVLDISLSMLADDMPPNRLTVATQTASQFVRQLPDGVRVGLLLFAGSSVVVSPPVTNHEHIARYLMALKPDDLRPRTEIGTAIQTATQAMQTPESPALNSTERQVYSSPTDKTANRPLDQVMVVLSDGDSREGYPWDIAAQEAKAAGIRVDTVAIGRPEPTTITYKGQVLPVSFSPDTLKQVAEKGGGRFFQALNADDFKAIYQQLGQGSLHLETQKVSLAPWLCGVGLAVLSLLIGFWCKKPWLKPDV